MSPTRLTAPFSRSGAFRRGAFRSGAGAALALGGLLLTGACGTVHAGAEADAAPAAAVTASTPRPSTPNPSTASPSTAPTPAAPASRVRTPLTLPVTAVSTGGSITGTVSSGMLGCLVVRTDAGQVFSVAGGPTARLRKLLPAGTLAGSSTGGPDSPGVGGGVSGSAGVSGGLRISAAGTLRAAPSFCGASYTFTIASVSVESLSQR